MTQSKAPIFLLGTLLCGAFFAGEAGASDPEYEVPNFRLSQPLKTPDAAQSDHESGYGSSLESDEEFSEIEDPPEYSRSGSLSSENQPKKKSSKLSKAKKQFSTLFSGFFGGKKAQNNQPQWTDPQSKLSRSSESIDSGIGLANPAQKKKPSKKGSVPPPSTAQLHVWEIDNFEQKLKLAEPPPYDSGNESDSIATTQNGGHTIPSLYIGRALPQPWMGKSQSDFADFDDGSMYSSIEDIYSDPDALVASFKTPRKPISPELQRLSEEVARAAALQETANSRVKTLRTFGPVTPKTQAKDNAFNAAGLGRKPTVPLAPQPKLPVTLPEILSPPPPEAPRVNIQAIQSLGKRMERLQKLADPWEEATSALQEAERGLDQILEDRRHPPEILAKLSLSEKKWLKDIIAHEQRKAQTSDASFKELISTWEDLSQFAQQTSASKQQATTNRIKRRG